MILKEARGRVEREVLYINKSLSALGEANFHDRSGERAPFPLNLSPFPEKDHLQCKICRTEEIVTQTLNGCCNQRKAKPLAALCYSRHQKPQVHDDNHTQISGCVRIHCRKSSHRCPIPQHHAEIFLLRACVCACALTFVRGAVFSEEAARWRVRRSELMPNKSARPARLRQALREHLWGQGQMKVGGAWSGSRQHTFQGQGFQAGVSEVRAHAGQGWSPVHGSTSRLKQLRSSGFLLETMQVTRGSRRDQTTWVHWRCTNG